MKHQDGNLLKVHPSAWVLLALMLAFTAWFSAYSIRLHDAHLTHKSDLGQIDLAIWNTAHGRFVQETKQDQVSVRLTDHVEPIFLPLSLIFWVWDDVRALLVLQAAALALGAWPIYLYAARRLAGLSGSRVSGSSVGVEATDDGWARWGGVVFAATYLLTPALQAPAAAEFHALPLAAPLIAWGLWAIERGQWGRFLLAGVLLMGVQEGMALLAAGLGLYALLKRPASEPSAGGDAPGRSDGRSWQLGASGAVLLLGLAWFYVTTFVIIPHYSEQVRQVSQTPYAARYGALGDSFGDVLRALVLRPLDVLGIAAEPLRVQYLIALLAPTAFLALLGPEILALSLPLLLANLLSSYPLQYSGELHYSAPLVPYVTLAAAAGLARLVRGSELLRRSVPIGRRRVPGLALGLALVAAFALARQALGGFTPIGGQFWWRIPGGWPEVTSHHRLLGRFAAQIPREAALSASSDLFPHLSHRELIYQFPWLGGATWVLVDVSGTTDRHPNDVRSAIDRLLSSGWGVVDAADGYILLAQGRGQAAIPDAFYDFARGTTASVPYRLDIAFGQGLRLVGYDVVDDRKWRRTALRLYWQVLAPLPEHTTISVQVLAPDGRVSDDTALRPMPALLWYPSDRWRAGEAIVTTGLPWFLPRQWAPVVRVATPAGPLAPEVLSHPGGGAGPAGPASRAQVVSGGQVRLPAWERRDGRLAPMTTPRDVAPAEAHFAGEGWSVRLSGWAAPLAVAPGQGLPLTLRWEATGPAARDYTVFAHLRDEGGRTVANGDASPTWFTPQPTSGWPPAPSTVWDGHLIQVPVGVSPGRYDLVIGWYDWETGKRLQLMDAGRNAPGDEFVLGPVTVHGAAGPRPDIPCLLLPDSCASLD